MRAAVLREFGRPLALEDVADPAAGAGEVVVEVRAVGLCGTDLKITGGAFAETPLPLPAVNRALERLRAGDVLGRLVIQPQSLEERGEHLR